MKQKELVIETPTLEQVEFYLKEWDKQDNYVLQENSLRKLFRETYPKNQEIDDVLIKVCSLNDFYSTNIYYVFDVAKHIIELDIDKRLEKGDVSLVNEIALNKVKAKDKDSDEMKEKKINYYSFASKYCSHHKPKEFPIYDSYVEKILLYFRGKDKFYSFKNEELKDYPKYKEILIQFSKHYKLEQYDLKQLDRYLWQLGKKYFNPYENSINKLKTETL
ncbi:MAG: hypothetical protein LBN27_07115 [Prevotellaceae bacterium]|jgi:hypothetical protein|nr:hypothetical protein [Prevotellaceae bacterium]